ncbi:Sulfatase [Hexamita inflata]|uniref:Sulfatase n=1 Tax=Hexamita inflata TaxID=28002 RepID=A0AA86NB19_9EUKA|nr:Sulfatase [Hexamita inflata]
MKKINIYLSVPCSLFAIQLSLTILKFTDRTSSNSQMMPSQLLIIPNIIVGAIDFASIGILNYLVNCKIKSNKITCVIFSTVTFYMIYSIVIQLADFMNLRETLQQFSKYYFATYVLRLKSMFNDRMKITGLLENDGNAQMFSSLMNRSPVPWAIIFTSIILVLLFHIFTIVLSMYNKISKKRINAISNTSSSDSSTIQTAASYDDVPLLVDQNRKQHKEYVPVVITTIVWLLELIIFVIYMVSDEKLMKAVAPSYWNFYRTGRKNKLDQNKYFEAVKQFRQSNELMAGYDWIDQRSNPEFPMVYAPRNMFVHITQNCSTAARSLKMNRKSKKKHLTSFSQSSNRLVRVP